MIIEFNKKNAEKWSENLEIDIPEECVRKSIKTYKNTKDMYVKNIQYECYFRPKHKNAKIFQNHLNQCHDGIHWIALAKHSQMSTHMPWFQSCFIFYASFCNGQISHHQHKG